MEVRREQREMEITGRIRNFPEKKVQPGHILVVVGSIGQVGAKTLLAAKREWFSPWFSPEYLERIFLDREKRLEDVELFQEKNFLEKYGVAGLQVVEEGGILRAIWEFSGEYPIGISFTFHCIPIKQQVIEICERCGANPYRLWCGNCLLLAARKGWQLARELKEQGVEAEAIGEVQEGIVRKICHGGEIGYLERPKEDELYRLLGREVVENIWDKALWM